MKKKHVKGVTRASAAKAIVPVAAADYGRLVTDLSVLLEQARRTAVRAVNNVLTATYWEIGRRIVDHKQGGRERAAYGERLLARLSKDLASAGPLETDQLEVLSLLAESWEDEHYPIGYPDEIEAILVHMEQNELSHKDLDPAGCGWWSFSTESGPRA